MFHNKKFKIKYSVDKRGRPTNLTTSDNLKKFYELSSESENEDDEKNKITNAKTKKLSNSGINKYLIEYELWPNRPYRAAHLCFCFFSSSFLLSSLSILED